MARTLIANGKQYIISQLDISLADVARVLEHPITVEKLKHKTEYTGCYTPRWAEKKEAPKSLGVKVVVDTRSKLKLKTVHNLGDCQEEQTHEDNL